MENEDSGKLGVDYKICGCGKMFEVFEDTKCFQTCPWCRSSILSRGDPMRIRDDPPWLVAEKRKKRQASWAIGTRRLKQAANRGKKKE